MSNRWPGGLIRKTPVTPAGPLQNGAAPGMWSLADAAYWTKQGLWPIAGNFLAVEDVFSTWLYTGNSGSQTITNGIDLAGKGGLVWTKVRNSNFNHILADTTRGGNNVLYSNSSVGNQAFGSTIYTAFGSAGYTLGNANEVNGAFNYASWTFREAPNFFDVVTWTGNGANRTIAHNLGVAPGCILVKRTDAAADWQVYHRSTGNTQYTVLNTTAAAATGTTRWNSTTPTATEFTVGTDATVNASGGTYVAYLFAHDATSDGIIQCGTFTTDASKNFSVNLGWEPQWILHKAVNAITGWNIFDTMRQWDVSEKALQLLANTTQADFGPVSTGAPTATGVLKTGGGSAEAANTTYIYIAIRRGPMKTPTLGTSVFAVDPQNITISSAPRYRSGFVTDMLFWKEKNTVTNWTISSRLTGTGIMSTNTTAAETSSAFYKWDYMNGALNIASNDPNKPAWMFRRAPGFFDEVCYTGTGVTGQTISHNLGVAPELIIIKKRNAGSAIGWFVGGLFNSSDYKQIYLNKTDQADTVPYNAAFPSQPTATQFAVSSYTDVGASTQTYVAYLFASCPGVSKVGSYTGNGSSQTINCGFTTGARFVLIKRTDSTGDWYVWDSARGIVAGNDPYLLLNSTAAEVTSTNYVDTDTTGFKVTAAAPAGINAVGGTYIFLAIA